MITPQINVGWHVMDIFLGVPIVWNIIDNVTGGDQALSPDYLIVPIPPEDAAVDRWW